MKTLDTLVNGLSEFFGLDSKEIRVKLERDIVSGMDVTSVKSNSYSLVKGLIDKFDSSDEACKLLYSILMI